MSGGQREVALLVADAPGLTWTAEARASADVTKFGLEDRSRDPGAPSGLAPFPRVRLARLAQLSEDQRSAGVGRRERDKAGDDLPCVTPDTRRLVLPLGAVSTDVDAYELKKHAVCSAAFHVLNVR